MDKVEKMNELLKDEKFVAGLAASQTAEDAKAYLAENGIEYSDEEVAALGKNLAAIIKAKQEANGELTLDQLEQIAGGGAGDVSITIPTTVVLYPVIGGGKVIDAAEEAWEAAKATWRWVTTWF